VARLGGDELMILLERLGLPQEVEPVARGLLECMPRRSSRTYLA
jgi:hypothetical protein